MKYDLMFIGPACRDENIDYDGSVVRGVGGAVYFCDFAARAAGANVLSAIKINPEDRDVADAFHSDPEHLRILPSSVTTRMKNVYTSPTRETRIATCEAQSDPIRPEEVPEDSFSICHLSGLLYGDFPNELITRLAERCRLSADAQGFLRHNDHGPMNFYQWEDQEQYLSCFAFLKTDAAEAKILTGLDDRKEAARILHERGAGEVLITHNTEVLVYDGTAYYTCPIRARNLSGRTGRGDTTMGVYLARRAAGDSVARSVLYATAAVSLKMETPGPLMAALSDIEAYIDSFYSDRKELLNH